MKGVTLKQNSIWIHHLGFPAKTLTQLPKINYPFIISAFSLWIFGRPEDVWLWLKPEQKLHHGTKVKNIHAVDASAYMSKIFQRVRCTTQARTHTHTKEEEEEEEEEGIERSEGILLVNVAFKASVPLGLSLRSGKLLKEFRQWPWRRGPLHFLESIHKLLRRHIAPIHLLFFTTTLPAPPNSHNKNTTSQ